MAEPITDLETRILKSMIRSRRRAEAAKCDNGFRGVMEIVGGFGISKKVGRTALERLAAGGLIERKEFRNGLFWRAPAEYTRPSLTEADPLRFVTIIELPGIEMALAT